MHVHGPIQRLFFCRPPSSFVNRTVPPEITVPFQQLRSPTAPGISGPTRRPWSGDPPQRSNFAVSNSISVSLDYEQWCETLATVVQLWEMKLEGKGFGFVPHLVSNIELPSDRLELNDRLKVLFLEKLKGLKEGVLVEKWMKKLDYVEDEIRRISSVLRDKGRLRVFNELCEKREMARLIGRLLKLGSCDLLFGSYELGTLLGSYELGTLLGSYELGTLLGSYELGTLLGSYELGTLFGSYELGTLFGSS
ncbi:hypothetical protein SASPL_141642 [Salvia splendens]|uniref:Uncharacterized protein n=1 Tax=Salvia splendens TaxID=180675 RepID=A0A8X8ZDM5_SALSN|nr:hypothetical protein SASPL_141642 [Salvia splendens]